MQAAGDLVAAAPELAAGVQDSHDDLKRRLPLVRSRLLGFNRNAAPVVGHSAATVSEEYHVDPGSVSSHRFVNGVVHDLPDAVMQPRRPCRADIHAWALPDRVKPFEHLDLIGAVVRCLRHRGTFSLSDRGSSAHHAGHRSMRAGHGAQTGLPNRSRETRDRTRHGQARNFGGGDGHLSAKRRPTPISLDRSSSP